jgi:hypothetical protein
MSRTTRRRPYGFNKGERHHNRAVAEHVPGDRWNDVNRNDLFNNRDAKPMSDNVRPAGRGPKGYDTHDSVGANARADAKRGAHRILRIRGKAEINKELRDE